MPNINVYCPTGIAITEKFRNFAPRIKSFEGKRIGLQWNGKPNGDFFLNRVAELLGKKYPKSEIIKLWEVYPRETAHADRKTKEQLDLTAKSADIVISAQAD